MPDFVDTNILVYAEDAGAGKKHDTARDLVLAAWDRRDGVVSVQVLQEFYVTVTRKLKQPLSTARAAEIIGEYMTWTVVDSTKELLAAAMDLQQRAVLSFWDAMIVCAAIEAGCERLYTEDLNNGQKFGGVQITNPFATRRRSG